MEELEIQNEKGNPEAELEQFLPLDAPERVAAWKNQSGTVRRHVFRRLTSQDWAGYFARIRIESDDKSRLIDISSAAAWLYGQAALRAEGYIVRGGGRLEDLPNWRERIPLGHRLQAIGELTSAKPAAGEAAGLIEPELEIAAIDARWGEGEPGKPLEFRGLIHRFRVPSAEDSAEYSREVSRTIVVRGSLSGKTIYPVREKVLVKLYDRLIESVEGYSAGRHALSGREEITREMDTYHKVVAAGQLFSLAGEEEAVAE